MKIDRVSFVTIVIAVLLVWVAVYEVVTQVHS